MHTLAVGTDYKQQLLEIWRNAKGKERDALLWGDEVRKTCLSRVVLTVQIEYLVVNFEDQERKVKLSLRQADILAALASNADLLKQGGGVPELIRGTVK